MKTKILECVWCGHKLVWDKIYGSREGDLCLKCYRKLLCKGCHGSSNRGDLCTDCHAAGDDYCKELRKDKGMGSCDGET